MKNIYELFMTKIIANIKWDLLRYKLTGRKYGLTWNDHKDILEVLSKGNYIILTWRSSHLTSYLTAFGHFILTGRWQKISHALMNIELLENVNQSNTTFLEATGEGVHKSHFYQVFDCDRAIILRPLTDDFDWEDVIEEVISNEGKKYDNLFSLSDESEMSCVELILDGLSRVPDHLYRFHGLYSMIKNEGNLTPAMYIESGSFEVVLDIYRPWFSRGYKYVKTKATS